MNENAVLNGKPTIAYRKWSSMIQRCTNPCHPAWPYYGGRGITVCDAWTEHRTGFQAFFEHLGAPPAGHWLDRIDNNIGYQPGNVRWVTPKQSAANRQARRPTDPNSLRQLCLKVGMPYATVYQRIRWGWTLERALTVPKRNAGRYPGERLGVKRDETKREFRPGIKSWQWRTD
jgi:hypothetical protein